MVRTENPKALVITLVHSAALPAEHVRAPGLFGRRSDFVELFIGSSA